MGSTMRNEFYPDPIKTSKRNHPSLMFNNKTLNLTTAYKHLDMTLDSKLSFDKHLKLLLSKISKTIGLLKKFQETLLK